MEGVRLGERGSFTINGGADTKYIASDYKLDVSEIAISSVTQRNSSDTYLWQKVSNLAADNFTQIIQHQLWRYLSVAEALSLIGLNRKSRDSVKHLWQLQKWVKATKCLEAEWKLQLNYVNFRMYVAGWIRRENFVEAWELRYLQPLRISQERLAQAAADMAKLGEYVLWIVHQAWEGHAEAQKVLKQMREPVAPGLLQKKPAALTHLVRSSQPEGAPALTALYRQAALNRAARGDQPLPALTLDAIYERLLFAFPATTANEVAAYWLGWAKEHQQLPNLEKMTLRIGKFEFAVYGLSSWGGMALATAKLALITPIGFGIAFGTFGLFWSVLGMRKGWRMGKHAVSQGANWKQIGQETLSSYFGNLILQNIKNAIYKDRLFGRQWKRVVGQTFKFGVPATLAVLPFAHLAVQIPVSTFGAIGAAVAGSAVGEATSYATGTGLSYGWQKVSAFFRSWCGQRPAPRARAIAEVPL